MLKDLETLIRERMMTICFKFILGAFRRFAPDSNILMCEFLDLLFATNDVEGRMLLVCGII